MKNIKWIISLGIAGILSFSFDCNAQQANCSENYEKALKLYNYGLADSALAVLNPCLTNKKALNNISKETGADIFRLAALSSIIKGDPVKAEEYVKEMLRYQPDYKNNPREGDLMEFRMIVNKTYSQPALRIGVTGGINLPSLELEKKYSEYETSFGGEYSLDGITGYQLQITLEKTLTKKISLELAAGITQIYFKYSVAAQLASRYNYDQSIKYLEIPVIIRYYLTTSHLKPYLQGGITGRISLNNMESSDTYGRYWFTESSNSNKILTTFLTDYEQVGLVLGGGLGYDMKKINLVLDFRYNYNLKSSESSNFDNVNGYDDISTDEKFYYTDDINLIKMKNIQISIGILYNLKYKVF